MTSHKDYLLSSTEHNFKFEFVTATSVDKRIRQLKSKNSHNMDGLFTIFLLSISTEITNSNTIFPDSMKTDKVIPMHKKD